MTIPPTKDILHIDSKVLELFGMTYEQFSKLTLVEMSDLAHDKGLVWEVSSTNNSENSGALVTYEQTADDCTIG